MGNMSFLLYVIGKIIPIKLCWENHEEFKCLWKISQKLKEMEETDIQCLRLHQCFSTCGFYALWGSKDPFTGVN